MEKTKKQRTINKLFTLTLAFVMVFTGMGIGSWGVSEAWADASADVTNDVLSSENIVGTYYEPYTGCEIQLLFIKVPENTEKLTLAGSMKDQDVLPYVYAFTDESVDISEFALIDNKYFMLEKNDEKYDLGKKGYEKYASAIKYAQNVELDNSADHLLLLLCYETDESLDALLIEWGELAQVDKSDLGEAITNAEKLGSGDVYQSDDRFNGKDYLTKGSFWSIMTEKLANAKAIYSNENALQGDVDDAKNELQSAIANLIPKTQINATTLYEAIQTRGNYTDEFLEKLTAPSLKAYKETLKAATDYLESLFDKGKATAENDVTKDKGKADELANALMEFEFVWQDSVSEAKENLRMLQALAKRYDMTENNGKYTDESWKTFASARKAAVEYAEEHPVSESMSSAETKEYSRLTREFLAAAYALTSAKDKITVTFDYTDDFHMRNPKIDDPYENMSDPDGNKVQKQICELNSGTTLNELYQKMGYTQKGNYFTSENYSTWRTFVNGTMLYGSTPGQAKTLPDSDYVLKNGDEIQFVHMDWPSYTVNYIYREDVSWDKMADILGVMQISGKRSVNSGEAIDLTVKRTSAHPWTYTGKYGAYEGATIAAYGPQTDGSYPETPVLSEGVSKEDGSVSLKLYKSGKYIVTAYDARKNDEDNSLFYSGTVAAPYIEIEVKDAADTGAVKAELKAALNKVYKAYAEEYFRPEKWTDIQNAYNEATAVLNRADSTVGEAYDAQQAAISTIQGIQEETTTENTNVLATFRENLNNLPDDLSLITKSEESIVTALINTYNGMSKYQQSQLTALEDAKYKKIEALKLEALPEGKEYKLNLKVTADTTEATEQIQKLIQYMRENPPKMDRAAGGWYDHSSAINIVTPYTFGTYDGGTELFAKTFTQAAPLTDVRIYTEMNYAAYFHNSFESRNQANGKTLSFSIPSTNCTITDENFDIVLMAPTKGSTPGFYSTGGHLTIKIGDTAYELKGITYEGIDEDAVTSGTQRVYDDSGYKGKDDQTVNVDIPEAYLGFTMPYNDVTITLNWGPVTSADELQAAKDNANSVLDETFAGYKKEKASYSDSNWTILENAYNAGKSSIKAATTLDEVADARKTAINAMAKVKKEGTTVSKPDSVGTVYVTVENTTFPKSKWEGKTYWEGKLVDNMPIEITEKSTMMSCVVEALKEVRATQKGAESNYISEITDKNGNKLGEFDGGPSSGWMGTLNDWFTNLGFGSFTVANGTLGDGDEIRIMYTTNGLGEDLGGSWANSDTTLKDLSVSGGTLSPSFTSGTSGNTYEYTLLISGKTANVKVTPTASNKNFLAKIFLNEKVTNNTQGASFYKRTQYIPVTAGDTIYVGCGERQWASMNNQEGNVQTNGGTWYVIKVVSGDNAKEHIEKAINALPAADKVKLSNYKTVDASVKEIESLLKALSSTEQAKIDQTKLKAVKEKVKFYTEIDDVKAKLNALTDSSSSSQAREALKAWEKLSKEQQQYITMADTAKYTKLAEKYGLSGISGAAEMPESEVETTGKTGSATTTSPTEVKMSGTTAIVTVKADNQKEILKQAKEKKSAEVVLTVAEADSKGAEKYELNLDKSFIQSLIKDTTAKLVVKTPIGQKTYDREALQKLVDEATTAVIKAEINKDNLDQQAEEPTVDVKALTAKLTPVARSAKTAKKNVKVTVNMDKQDKEILSQLTEAGYTVKYRFYRSTKKSAGFKSTVTKKTATYTNTSGKKGTKYFYKVQVRVYDEKGKLVATTALKRCKYASRTWSK